MQPYIHAITIPITLLFFLCLAYFQFLSTTLISIHKHNRKQTSVYTPTRNTRAQKVGGGEKREREREREKMMVQQSRMGVCPPKNDRRSTGGRFPTSIQAPSSSLP